MTLDKYTQALMDHDWYYAYADGYSDYVKGKEQRDKLEEVARKVDPEFKVWNEIAPPQFKIIKK